MLLIFSDFFLLIQGFVRDTLYEEETPEDKNIAKMLIEEYKWFGHNFINYFELQAAEKS
jgi:hypothetical protein